MRLLTWLSSVKASVSARPKAPSQDVLAEADYRRQVDAAAAARRAERAKAIDMLIGDRPPWIARRGRWL